MNLSSLAKISYTKSAASQSTAEDMSNLANVGEVAMQLAAICLNAVEVVSVAWYDLGDKLVCDEILPESSSRRLATVYRSHGSIHMVSGLFNQTSDLVPLSRVPTKKTVACTVRFCNSFTLAVAEAVISAIEGYGPPEVRGPPPASPPLQPPAPGAGAPFEYPFMAYTEWTAGRGKGAAARTTAAYAQGTCRMVGGRERRRDVSDAMSQSEAGRGERWAVWAGSATATWEGGGLRFLGQTVLS